MFQTGPKIHGYGAYLHFHRHIRRLIGKEYGNAHDHMITPVTIRFGMLDIIFLFDDRDIILLGQRLCQPINIIYIRADHPDTRHIIKAAFHVFYSKIKTFAV